MPGDRQETVFISFGLIFVKFWRDVGGVLAGFWRSFGLVVLRQLEIQAGSRIFYEESSGLLAGSWRAFGGLLAGIVGNCRGLENIEPMVLNTLWGTKIYNQWISVEFGLAGAGKGVPISIWTWAALVVLCARLSCLIASCQSVLVLGHCLPLQCPSIFDQMRYMLQCVGPR